MAFDVQWYIQDRVVLAVMLGDITIDDMRGMRQATRQLFDETEQSPIHLIIDNQQTASYKFNIGDMIKTVRESDLDYKDRTGYTLMINKPTKIGNLTAFFSTIIGQVVENRTRMFNNLDDAMVFLKEMDDRL
jgi:hypothetical protein